MEDNEFNSLADMNEKNAAELAENPELGEPPY
jgi:hypothetical protein